MQFILLSLEKYELFFYLVLAFFGVIVFRWLALSWKQWRDSYFGLERELAMRNLAQATAAASLIFIAACAVFILGSFVVPGLPATAFLSTPTLDLLATPVGDAASGSSTLAMTSIPAAPIPGSEGCVPDKLEITSPKPGEAINGKIEIVGTVNVDGMGFYKYEFAALGSDLWATISADRTAKRNEPLGSWFTGALTPGDYQLRLVVTDTQGVSLPPCIITVRIIGQ